MMKFAIALLSLAAAASAQIPNAELESLYGAAYPGAGIRSTAIVPESPCAAGEYLRVNTAETGLECAAITTSADFTDLGDTPSAISADLCVKGNSAGDALTFGQCGSGGGGTADGYVSSGMFTKSGEVFTLTIEQTEGQSDVTADFEIEAANVPSLDAAKIASGTFGAARIPNLAASKVTSGTLDDARIPASIARDTELPVVAAGTNVTVTPSGTLPRTYTVSASGGGTADGTADSVDVSVSGQDLTVTVGRSIGADLSDTVTLPQGADGVVSGGSVAGTTLTLNRTNSLADVTITGLPTPGGTATDGVVDSADLTVSGQDLTLTLGRTIGADVDASVTLPGGGLSTVATAAPVSGDGSAGNPVTVDDGAIGNAKISGVAASKLTGIVADASIAATLARDSEVESFATVGNAALVPTAKLASNSASDELFLRGDQTWATPAGGGGVSSLTAASGLAVTSPAGDVTIGIQAGGVNSGHLQPGIVTEPKIPFDNNPAIGKFVGWNAAGFHWDDPPATGGGLTAAQMARLLPELPQPGNRDVVTNAAGNAYALTPHLNLDDIFPRVAALPDHTAADAPAFVYLDHSITEGTREDANLTIGEAAGFYGYSRLPPAFGSINKPSPLGQLIGQATANSITEAWSTNAAWLGQFTHVVLGNVEYALGVTFQSGPWHIRNITGAPTGITALSLNVNFKKADGAYFFQGPGHTVLFNEGWYELLSSGYSRIASTGYLHTSGQGGPIGQPTFEGQRFVNEFGQLWIAGGERARVTVAAGGTSGLLVHDEYNRDPTTIQQNFNRSGNGGFAWDFEIESGDGGFYQFQGAAIGDIVYGLTWNQVWTYICTLPGGNTAANIRRRDHSSWLGGFGMLSGALHELGQRVTQAVFDAGATDYYSGLTRILPQTQRGVRQILTYTAATTIITNDLFWKGPLLDENDAQALIDAGAVEVNGTATVDQGNANRITVGTRTWGTKPIQDRRAAGLPAAAMGTLDNLFEDTRGVWRGSSYIDEERDAAGTFTDVAFARLRSSAYSAG